MVRYLTEKEVILINALVIKRYTPGEMVGVKDYSLFNSALNRPQQSAFGEDAYPDLWTKAAALYASIAQNHGFHNANKRTAFAAMKQFLWVNNYNFVTDEPIAEEFTLYVVNQKTEIEEIAEFIKKYSVKR